MTRAVVQVDARLRARRDTGCGCRWVWVDWSWTSTDPYAVTLRFHSVPGAVVWRISREVLIEGLSAPAGIGDVSVSPTPAEGFGAGVVIALSNGRARARFWFNTAGVAAFTTATLDHCPLGEETRWVDLDAELSALLDDPHQPRS